MSNVQECEKKKSGCNKSKPPDNNKENAERARNW